ncbi:MAG: UDP-N-acetylmuramate dehydrogenase [Rhodospirillales bacterium]|nr:UDP-N-acetylmuramate dehydrogenase [Alphaproteobacteria bacterium]USO04543.1 MAG: UDP-N-acetylmuramate dehydrogenase [Rhodospirillales bacterium]
MRKAKTISDSLPEVRGRYSFDEPLGRKSWFGCGGRAEVLFKPADAEDLISFLRNCSGDVPVTVLGALSNVIVREGGIPGVTVRLGRAFADIETEGDLVKAGALALDANVALAAAEAGIAGLEFYSGIPGSIGGALRMNAGCYGRETKDVLVRCEAVDREGTLHVLTPDQMGMTYRHTEAPEDYIFISATFRGQKDKPEKIKARIAQIKQRREDSQPLREKTGGSTFANPLPAELVQAGLPEDTKVWQLIEDVGGRGLRVGGAKMSEKHCNFMINEGEASAADLEALGEEIRKRIYETHGIRLRWEIKRMGERA